MNSTSSVFAAPSRGGAPIATDTCGMADDMNLTIAVVAMAALVIGGLAMDRSRFIDVQPWLGGSGTWLSSNELTLEMHAPGLTCICTRTDPSFSLTEIGLAVAAGLALGLAETVPVSRLDLGWASFAFGLG